MAYVPLGTLVLRAKQAGDNLFEAIDWPEPKVKAALADVIAHLQSLHDELSDVKIRKQVVDWRPRDTHPRKERLSA